MILLILFYCFIFIIYSFILLCYIYLQFLLIMLLKFIHMFFYPSHLLSLILDQWFLNFSKHQNNFEGLRQHTLITNLFPRGSDLVDLGGTHKFAFITSSR